MQMKKMEKEDGERKANVQKKKMEKKIEEPMKSRQELMIFFNFAEIHWKKKEKNDEGGKHNDNEREK